MVTKCTEEEATGKKNGELPSPWGRCPRPSPQSTLASNVWPADDWGPHSYLLHPYWEPFWEVLPSPIPPHLPTAGPTHLAARGGGDL